MTTLVVVCCLVFIVAVVMTMVGKGGGNFYVVILTFAHIPMHEAATTGQFILFAASAAAMLIFQKNKSISWKLAVLVGTCTALSAFGGGYFSNLFSGFALKLLFSVLLMTAGIVMLVPLPATRGVTHYKSFGIMHVNSGGEIYDVNAWITLPVAVSTGFVAGMVGVSGGSFLVPIMALACRVPMHTAVGTASVLIATSALMGFTGHAVQGDFYAH
jgi:uncharacterized membrane protein YfcA